MRRGGAGRAAGRERRRRSGGGRSGLRRSGAGEVAGRAGPTLWRERPGAGFRHVLRLRDLERFLELLPDRDELVEGLDAVVLAPGDPELHGWYQTGVIAICAWSRELPQAMSYAHFERERPLLERLGVPIERRAHDVLALFDETTVRGFQLMEVFLHELGHHRDRVTTRTRIVCARGEPFAERYALEYGERVWARYREEFSHP